MGAPIRPAAMRPMTAIPPTPRIRPRLSPSPPAPPRPNESGEAYRARCGPFVLVNGAWLQKSFVEWVAEQPVRPVIKEQYTLEPRRRMLPLLLFAILTALLCVMWFGWG